MALGPPAGDPEGVRVPTLAPRMAPSLSLCAPMPTSSTDTLDTANAAPMTSWSLEWRYLSDYSCMWRGGVDDLWYKLLCTEKSYLETRMETDHSPDSTTDSLGTPSHMTTAVQASMNQREASTNPPEYDWDAWDGNLPVGVRAWAQGVHSAGGPADGVSAVLTTTGFYLIFSPSALQGAPYLSGHSLNLSYDEGLASTTLVDTKSCNTEQPVTLRTLPGDREKELWLDPFMELVDNGLLAGSASFRAEIRGYEGKANESDLIRDTIHDAQPNFLADYPSMVFAVDGQKSIGDSTFSYDGTNLTLTLGAKEPAGPTSPEKAPKWPCGNITGSP
jgi:hypothetical protein